MAWFLSRISFDLLNSIAVFSWWINLFLWLPFFLTAHRSHLVNKWCPKSRRVDASNYCIGSLNSEIWRHPLNTKNAHFRPFHSIETVRKRYEILEPIHTSSDNINRCPRSSPVGERFSWDEILCCNLQTILTSVTISWIPITRVNSGFQHTLGLFIRQLEQSVMQDGFYSGTWVQQIQASMCTSGLDWMQQCLVLWVSKAASRPRLGVEEKMFQTLCWIFFQEHQLMIERDGFLSQGGRLKIFG